jgi:hypothetical protein
MGLANSLSRLGGVHGESKQILEGGPDGSS